jgi:hypothetical protein
MFVRKEGKKAARVPGATFWPRYAAVFINYPEGCMFMYIFFVFPTKTTM